MVERSERDVEDRRGFRVEAEEDLLLPRLGGVVCLELVEQIERSVYGRSQGQMTSESVFNDTCCVFVDENGRQR